MRDSNAKYAMNQSSFNYVNGMQNNNDNLNKEVQTLNLDKLKEKINYTFDYEVNSIKLDDNDDMNCKMSYYSPTKKSYRILNYAAFDDKLRPLPKITPTTDKKKLKYNTSVYDREFSEIDEKTVEKKKLKTANIMKRLVSKQKRRYQDEYFDLDMSYITDRVIAMGYPSTGCETIYRNSLVDVVNFFHKYHNDKVKIYNLCLEKERIYDKRIFSKSQVGLFPATDHNPCPIKLILEFCIDICLYLLKNRRGVAAVHCKAGKGRTGVMICSYLIFSGLCNSSEKAFRYYARIRTKDNTGVTIPSQKRYINYFETFLQANFCPPYIFLIPKIIKSHFAHLMVGQGRLFVKNILQSFQKEKGYFISANKFLLKKVRVGPLPRGKKIKLKICNFINNNFKIKNDELREIYGSGSGNTSFYEHIFSPELTIHSDIKITFIGVVNFYVWVNLWYSSWEMIKVFYDKAECKNNNKEDLEDIKKDLKEGENYKKYKFNDCAEIDSKGKMLIQNEEYNDNNNDNNNNNNNNNNNINNKSDNQIIEDMDEKETQVKSLYEIIYRLKHNTDLNELINRINMDLKNKFDKNKLEITLNSFEFDKFEESNNYPNIEASIFYSLLDK